MRTPTNKAWWDKAVNDLKPSGTVKQWAERAARGEAGGIFDMNGGKTANAGLTQIRFKEESPGSYSMQQRFSKEGTFENKDAGWATISSGWRAEDTVTAGHTYELELGAGGTANYDLSGDKGAAGSAFGYGKYKPFSTVQVNEANPPRGQRADQFRVRQYGPTPTFMGGVSGGGDGAKVLGMGSLDVARMEYRWGKLSKTPAVTNRGNGQPDLPETKQLTEFGVSVSANANFDLAALDRAKGDPAALQALAASMPSGALTLQYWGLGLFENQKNAANLAGQMYKERPDTPLGSFKNVAAHAVKYLGELFQHKVLTAAGQFVAGGTVNAIREAREALPPGGTGKGVPGIAAIAGQAGGALDDISGSFRALADKLPAGLSSLADIANDLIDIATTRNEIKNVASRKGRGDISSKKLSGEERAHLQDVILGHAFELAANDAAPGADGKADPRKSILKNAGESDAAYAGRMLSRIKDKLPQATAMAMTSDVMYDALDQLPDGPHDDKAKRGGGKHWKGIGNPLREMGNASAGTTAAAAVLGGILLSLFNSGKADNEPKNPPPPPPPPAPGGAQQSVNPPWVAAADRAGRAAAAAGRAADEARAKAAATPAASARATPLPRDPKGAADLATNVVKAGSKDNDTLNADEVYGGLRGAGLNPALDRKQLDRVISTYSGSGFGTLTSDELASAFKDGVLAKRADGSVVVNEEALDRGQRLRLTNVASRVITAGTTRIVPGQPMRNFVIPSRQVGPSTEAKPGEVAEGFRKAGYNVQASDDGLNWLVKTYGSRFTNTIDKNFLAHALRDGAIWLDGNTMGVNVNARYNPLNRPRM